LGPVVWVLSDYVAGAYEGPIIAAVLGVVSSAGGRVVAVQTVGTGTDYHQEITLKDLARVGWDRMDGVISIANAVPTGYLQELRQAGKPVVVIGDEPHFDCPVVLVDNRGGATEAVEHLLAHGHTRIAFVGSLGEFDIRERFEAYQATLRAHGISPDPDLFFEADNNLEHAGAMAAHALVAAGLPSSALFAATDLNAVGVMRALKEAGFQLPRDQAIVGFDDDPDGALVSPTLSTVSQDPARLGRLATELLLRQVAGEAVAPGRYLVPTSYVSRQSCGCNATAKDAPGKRDDAYYELRRMVRDDYKITLDLLDNHQQDPRRLDWLQNTDARLGALGLWRREGEGTDGDRRGPAPAEEPKLEIAGTFDASGQELDLPDRTMRVESFPPEAFLEAGQRDWLVFMFPLKSPETDWGFLAISQPLVPNLQQESCFTWSAVFSEALYHRELLGSLRQKSEELSLSNRREREMAQAVRESEERYALAARAANDGLWDWDLTTGALYVSLRVKEMLGFADTGANPNMHEWLERVHPEDRTFFVAEIEALRQGKSESITHEHRAQAGDGTYVWLLCRGLAVPGLGMPATRIVGSMTDVTERRSMEERLRQQALYDDLTGLPNRGLFLDRLSQVMAIAKRRPGHTYAVLWLDLDNFKHVNDAFGHLYGDGLLVQVAQRMSVHVRETDTAGRFGGDEFVMLLQVDDPTSVDGVVSRLSEHLNQPYLVRDQTVRITASIGIAMGGAIYDRPDEVLRDADLAMYSSKALRRGSFTVFEASSMAPSGRRRVP
jgi:diguanylate cyclase (GGDEF)-like protein